MKKLFIIIISIVFSLKSYSVVEIDSTMDFYSQGKAALAIAAVIKQAEGMLDQVKHTTDLVTQIQDLKSLRELKNDAGILCPNCTGADVDKVQSYVDSINNDLFGQISNIQAKMGAVGDIVNVINNLITNGVAAAVNPAATSAIVEQASVATLSNIQNTLLQIQTVQAQTVQLQLAEHLKLEADAQGTIKPIL